MPKLSDEFKIAFKEKFYSLLVSFKFITFFVTLGVVSFLAYKNYIDSNSYKEIIKTLIIIIGGARGAITVANVLKEKKGVYDEIKDKLELNNGVSEIKEDLKKKNGKI